MSHNRVLAAVRCIKRITIVNGMENHPVEDVIEKILASPLWKTKDEKDLVDSLFKKVLFEFRDHPQLERAGVS